MVGLKVIEKRLDVIHAWLVEDLDGGRCRILTQESQKGKPAVQLHNSHPNTMINGHQDWLDGIVKICIQNKGKILNKVLNRFFYFYF